MFSRSHCRTLLACVGAISLIGLIDCRASRAADAKSRDERFRQVELMSERERVRLQRNLDEFKKLPADQQTHYRELHKQLEENKSTGGQLSNLLQEYSAWLTTLTPSQRHELNNTTDTAQKLALVRQFKEAQEYRPDPSPADGTPPLMAELPMPKRGPFGGPPLKAPELAAVMNTIHRDLHGTDLKKPEGESMLRFYLELLRSSIESAPDGPRQWPSETLQLKLEQLPGVKEHLRKRPEGRRVGTIRLIIGSLAGMAFEGFKPPTEQDRLDIFNGLTPEEQTKIINQPEEGRRHLERMYFERRGDDMPRRIREMQIQMDRLLNDLGLTQANPLNWGGGPGGPRRPLDGGRPGGRNGPDRPNVRPNN